jgi:hypothetical protein
MSFNARNQCLWARLLGRQLKVSKPSPLLQQHPHSGATAYSFICSLAQERMGVSIASAAIPS